MPKLGRRLPTIVVPLFLLLASGAQAASLSTSGTSYRFAGTGTENNDLTVASPTGSVTFKDGSNPIVVSAAGCTPTVPVPANTTVTCAAAGITGVRILLGEGTANRLRATTALPLVVTGGDGADKIHGGSGADTIDAGAGDDIVTGGAGNDVLTP